MIFQDNARVSSLYTQYVFLFQDNARLSALYTQYMFLTHTNDWPCLGLRTDGPHSFVLILPIFVFWEVRQEKNTTIEGNMPYGTGRYVRFERSMGNEVKIKQSHYSPGQALRIPGS